MIQRRSIEDKATRRRGDKETMYRRISVSRRLLVYCASLRWSCRAVTYNTAMSQSRTTTGIFLVVLLAVIGYVLVMLPPRIVDGVAPRYEISPWVAYVYVGGRWLWCSLCLARCCWRF